MTKSFLIIFSVALFSCQQKSNYESDKTSKTNAQSIILDSLTVQLDELSKSGLINGFSVAIVGESKTLYENGFGYSNLKDSIDYSERTIQTIGSISKTLIGMSLLKAQEMGMIDLDDPINKYLPFQVENPYFQNDEITIRHLANHTSTIVDTEYYNKSYVLKNELAKSDTSDIFTFFNPPSDSISMFDFLKKTLTKNGGWYKKEGFLNTKPGESFKYSNAGATLAALIIELVSDDTFRDFTSKHILNPLKMTSSRWSSPETDTDQFSKLYSSTLTSYPSYYLITYPDGGFITSSNNLGKYLRELIKGYSGSGTLLDKSSYAEFFGKSISVDTLEKQAVNPIMELSFESGIFMGRAPKKHYGHTGADPGLVSLMLFNTETKIGRVLIANTDIQGENEEALNQLFTIWNKLEEYQSKLINKDSW